MLQLNQEPRDFSPLLEPIGNELIETTVSRRVSIFAGESLQDSRLQLMTIRYSIPETAHHVRCVIETHDQFYVELRRPTVL